MVHLHINHHIMKITVPNSALPIILFSCIVSSKMFSQDKTIIFAEDQKFGNLLSEKRKINPSITINDQFKIQIYNGNSEASKKILNDFKLSFLTFDATIVFYTPAYKVWVGNFKTRLEAERNLMLFKRKYPNAFIIKPNK